MLITRSSIKIEYTRFCDESQCNRSMTNRYYRKHNEKESIHLAASILYRQL